MTSEKKYQEMIDAAFLGDLSGAKFEELRGHLKSCGDCRARYDRVTRLERKLEGNVASPSSSELSRIESSIFARLDAEKPVESFASRLVRLLGSRTNLAYAGSLAAVIFAIAVLVPWETRELEGELRARGAGDGVRAATVRAFCVHDGEIAPAESGACSISSNLKLAIGNTGGYRYAFVVGVQGDREPRWYAPRPPKVESIEAPAPGDGEVPFGGAVKLDVNHEVGPLRVFALFSDAPIPAAEVEAAIAKAERSIVEVETLPLARKDVAQRSVLVQVSP